MGTLSNLSDVTISNAQTGQTLIYSAETGKWSNGWGGGTYQNISERNPVITHDGRLYLCGEVDSLSIFANDVDVIFISGTTAAELSAGDVILPEWFTGVEANTVYEILIKNGRGVINTWVLTS